MLKYLKLFHAHTNKSKHVSDILDFYQLTPIDGILYDRKMNNNTKYTLTRMPLAT